MMLGNETNKTQEANYSEDKSMVLKGQFTELLFKLEQDLQEIKELEIIEKSEVEEIDGKSENEDSQASFVARHFIELEVLKKIFTSLLVRSEDVTWFLRSAIFDLMSCEPESFSIEPLELYECMLERAELLSKDVFHEHLQALLDKKTDEKSNFPFVRFFPVLSAVRKRSAGIFLEDNLVPKKKLKLPRCVPPSPLALQHDHLSAEPGAHQDKHLMVKPLS